MQPPLRDVPRLPASDTPISEPDADLRTPLAELRDFRDNLLFLQRAQASLRARARLMEDEELVGRVEAILADSINVAVEQVSEIVQHLQAHLPATKVTS